MTGTIDFDALTREQTLALLRHVFERESASTKRTNHFLRVASAMLQRAKPVSQDDLIDLLNGWSADMNLIGGRSDAEIERIVAGELPASPPPSVN